MTSLKTAARTALALLLSAVGAQADKIVLVAGGPLETLPASAKEARLHEPFGTDFDAAGNLWIVEMVSGNRLLKMDPAGMLSHVAGQKEHGFAGDGGPALEAKFHGPHNLAVLPNGNVLVGDTWNGRVREVDVQSNKVDSLKGYEVPLEKAKGSGPYCVTLDFTGTRLFISDLRQVWVLDVASGERKLVAGNGQKGVPANGATATESPLVDPRAVAPDRLGNVYILERNGSAVRLVDKDGKIRTVVNASGKKGADGDGGPALEATMNEPKHICVDRDNSVLIADAENHLVRRYVPATGRLERVAGTGRKGSAGLDGPPEQCQLARPHGVTVNPKTGELFITDSYNDRVLKIVKE